MFSLNQDRFLELRHIAILVLSAQQMNDKWVFFLENDLHIATEDAMIVFGMVAETREDHDWIVKDFIKKGFFKKHEEK